jgi:energy-converting hydrogenase Eha subunit H
MWNTIKENVVNNAGYYIGVLSLVWSIPLFRDGAALAAWISVVLGTVLIALNIILTYLETRIDALDASIKDFNEHNRKD